MKKTLLLSLAFSAAFAGHAQAQNTLSQRQEFRTPIRASAVITNPSNNNHANYLADGTHASAQMQPQKSDVFLMNIPLTSDQKHKLQTFKLEPSNLKMSANSEPATLPARVDLGMNNVPVLNQGMHGTCVTFATTAALDALIGKGEYISPLCSLEVGRYLETRSYLPSGWDGSYGPLILDRFREFGIVTMTNQTTKSCAGVTQYPLSNMDDTGSPMSIDDYAQMSEDINFDFYWYPLVTSVERFAWDNTEQANKLLSNVKSALAAKNAKETIRLTFGSLLPVEHCSAGACAKYHKTDDTWALTKAIKNDQDPEFGGHEMVITGYDDNAVAIDNEGAQHKGLLILRNSWGDRHGDNGNYYMTYDFFKQYVMEVQEVGKY